MDSINRRIATRFPSGVCEQLDSRLKAGERVLLIAINTSSDEELLQLLVEKGIAPRDKQEAENVMILTCINDLACLGLA